MKEDLKIKEPIKIRVKHLTNGSKSIYLDIYMEGRRKYEFLKLYIIPEIVVTFSSSPWHAAWQSLPVSTE